MKLLDLEIDFPEIEGYSSRQEWYAKQLKEAYIKEHYDRFLEIQEVVMNEADKRDLEYADEELLETFNMKFNKYEKAVLYGVSAGGIIKALKQE